jgi:hypothetical protein
MHVCVFAACLALCRVIPSFPRFLSDDEAKYLSKNSFGVEWLFFTVLSVSSAPNLRKREIVIDGQVQRKKERQDKLRITVLGLQNPRNYLATLPHLGRKV